MSEPADGDERELSALYARILDSWNRASAESFAASFTQDGRVVGFDGSRQNGRSAIAAEIGKIFADHETGTYVGKVEEVRRLSPEVALLSAVAGLVPAGQSDIEPKLNAVQTLLAERCKGEWLAVLYQNTPAQFHGRPGLVEQLTRELREELRKRT
jgi:uncharacterized protein (TIGR02246 family)